MTFYHTGRDAEKTKAGGVDEAVAIANDTPYGLSVYVYAATPEAAGQIAPRPRTGNVHLNGAGGGRDATLSVLTGRSIRPAGSRCVVAQAGMARHEGLNTPIGRDSIKNKY